MNTDYRYYVGIYNVCEHEVNKATFNQVLDANLPIKHFRDGETDDMTPPHPGDVYLRTEER